MTDCASLIARATSCAAEKRYDEALELLTQACALEPESPTAWCNRAGILFLLARYEEAETDYRRALETKPDLLEALFGLARVNIARKRWQDAMTVIEQMPVVQEPAYEAERHYLRGIVFENTGQPEKARDDYRLALDLGYGPAGKPLVRLLIRSNETEKAIETCFAMTRSAKQRWQLVKACLTAARGELHLYERAAHLFLESRQYAYAARTCALAKHVFHDKLPVDWKGFRDCPWL